MNQPAATRRWRPAWPCPVPVVLGQHRRGAGDPTLRLEPGVVWRALRTPVGTATIAVQHLAGDGTVTARAWGAGADWALEAVPALLGAEDDPTGFEARHPLVAEGQRRQPHWRLSRTGLVLESLVPTVIEQKVTGQEAFAGFRGLVLRFGEPAPGPRPDLWVQPDAATLRGIPSWDWLALHIDPGRSRTVVYAAGVAAALERIAAPGAGVDAIEADRRLRSLPGVGEWTSAEVRARALGDVDAVSFGDYHVAKNVGWAVTGTAFSDVELAQYLEPWRPQRGRAVHYLLSVAGNRPRRGPRMAPRTHLPGA